MHKEVITRMQAIEGLYNLRVLPDQWIVLRLDGRSFSSLTEQHFAKPFDDRFHSYMLSTAIALLSEFNAPYAYTGSDEITVVLPQAFNQYDRRIEKLLSLSAAIASAEFMQKSMLQVHFDCRLLPFGSLEDVVLCCEWRRSDVRRNALQTFCYWTLRHEGQTGPAATRRIKRASWEEKIALLQERGINFHTIPSWQRQGISLYWETYEKEGFDPVQRQAVIAQRRRAVNGDIPDAYVTWLEEHLKKQEK